MSNKQDDAAPEPHTMTLAEINAFLKKQQAEQAEAAEAEQAEAADKPKRGRPAKAQDAE